MWKKPLRIFNHPWHLANQAEILKIPNTDWSWLIQYKRPYSEQPRGDLIKKFNIKWVPYYEKGKFDLAILHLDQQCLDDNLWEIGKGRVYRELNEQITDIPKIVIMHGTPYYPEQMSSKLMIERLKNIIGDNTMVVNSHKAKEQWGWGNVIIHGMDKNDWVDLPKEPRVITMISPAGLDKYYDRQLLLYVQDELRSRGIEHCHITVDVNFKNFEDYREFMGRSLIYFNPTKESPMPRSRTEAMFSGCCVVTTPHQDANTFIKNGVNGFLIPRNPKTIADLIVALIKDYENTVAIGQAGKKTAYELFSLDRFLKDWETLICNTLKI